MNGSNRSPIKIIAWMISVLIPILILLTALRILLTPAFVRLEYSTPNFPEDTYGFTKSDRLRWAPVALAYLLNDEDITFLSDLEFEDGTSLYNERELGHMIDVKNLAQASLRVWYGMLIIMIALGIWARRSGWWMGYLSAYRRGGWITIGIVIALLIFLLISFDKLFIGFHRVFFEGETWMFAYSDTLIRLFPMRFWQDVFIAFGALMLAGGIALAKFIKVGDSKT